MREILIKTVTEVEFERSSMKEWWVMGKASQDDPAGSHTGVCSPEAPAQGTDALG